jgi:tetratricopeptide (TPR) repeat protein
MKVSQRELKLGHYQVGRNRQTAGAQRYSSSFYRSKMNLEFTGEQIALHDRLSREGWKILDHQIQIHDRPPLGKPGWFVQRRLRKAISLLEQTLQINPTNWASMWGLGKIYQRLNDDSTALQWFIKAHQIEPTNADVVREAALCALNLGRSKEAVEFASAAIQLKPDDPGLVANLALALLLDHRVDEAKQRAQEAVIGSGNDAISRNVLQLVDDVISGRKSYPKTLKDVR